MPIKFMMESCLRWCRSLPGYTKYNRVLKGTWAPTCGTHPRQVPPPSLALRLNSRTSTRPNVTLRPEVRETFVTREPEGAEEGDLASP